MFKKSNVRKCILSAISHGNHHRGFNHLMNYELLFKDFTTEYVVKIDMLFMFVLFFI